MGKLNVLNIRKRFHDYFGKEVPTEKQDYHVSLLLEYKEALDKSEYYEMCWKQIKNKYKYINLYSVEYRT